MWDVDGNLDFCEFMVNCYNYVYGNGEVEDYVLFINVGKVFIDSVEFYIIVGYSICDLVGGGFYCCV